MSIKTETYHCVTITCDGADCGEVAGDEDTGTGWHFSDLNDAKTSLEDYWLIEPDRQLCHSCHVAETCAREGHKWRDWGQHWNDPTRETRFCDRDGCNESEDRSR